MRATWYIWLPLPPASRLVNLLPLPLPLSYNLTEIAGLITRGLLTIWFLKILPGLTLEPNSSPLKNHGMVFEIRDDPSAFCWSSAYSQARNVSLVWDSLSEFFFGESLGCSMPWHFVKDWVCISIQPWLRLYHKSGAWLWAMTKHEIRGSSVDASSKFTSCMPAELRFPNPRGR